MHVGIIVMLHGTLALKMRTGMTVMDIHHLRIFTAVYRNRSFTKAAADLRISQPTVSEHMRKLEEELGCQLFDRLGRTIVPTDRADLLYPKASRIVDELLALPSEISDEGTRMRGEIVFGASTIPGTYIMPELIGRFRRNFPLVSFRVVVEDTSQITARVTEHNLLCGVVGAPFSLKFTSSRSRTISCSPMPR